MSQSNNDLDKEKHEQEILDRAILLSKSKRKLTRDILSLMEGKTINRGKNDKPDIVKLHIDQVGDRAEIIGIEHFLVEQVTECKGKRGSIVKKKRSYIDNILSNNGPQAKEKVYNVIFDIAEGANTTGIAELRGSFSLVFENHLAKIDVYRTNLQELSDNQPIKMAFLIEIRSNADDIYLNNGRTVSRRHNSIYPTFSWMVKELEKIDANKLQYVILYMKNSLDNEAEDVIAIETNDIQGSLRKQGITVYDYCDDPSQLSFENLGISERGLEYSVKVENEGTFSDDMMPSLQQAYHYKKNNIPFVAPRVIQAMVYAFGKAVFIHETTRIYVKSEFSKDITLQRFDSFVKKYPIQETSDSKAI